MSRASARVATRWWTDDRFLALRPDAQRILVLLWTAPETNLCGLTPISIALLAERLRLTQRRVLSSLVELEDSEHIEVDPDSRLCWIKGYVEAQLGGMPADNKPWLKNTATAVAGLPQTAMVRKFKAAYRLLDHVPERAKKACAPRGSTRDPTRDPTSGYARGAPFRSLGVGVGVVPAADATAEADADTVVSSIAGGRRA